VDARIEATTKNLNLPCHRGCDACCRESVFITTLEFLYLWDQVQKTFDEHTFQEVIVRSLALYEKHREIIEAIEEAHDDPIKRTHWAMQLKFDCPFLSIEGACRVYPVRELYGRLFGCSFNSQGGVYGCSLSGKHLANQEVTLVSVDAWSRVLQRLPLTHMRQVYPYFIHHLYGIEGD
jgi:Fe-S-cluster containining protein